MEKYIGAPSAGLQAFSVRLGKIFFNLSVALIVVCAAGFVSFAATAAVLLVGLVVILLTLGTIFVIAPGFFSALLAVAQATADIAAFLLENMAWFGSAAAAAALLSILLLACDRQAPHPARISIAGCILAAAAVMIVVAVRS